MINSNTSTSTALDSKLEELRFHHGYDIQFNSLNRSDQLVVLSLAINDLRFDTYELICESDLYIERIIANVANGEIDEMDTGRIIYDRLILAITDRVQEFIDDMTADMKTDVSANDIKSYENEVVTAIFGIAS